MKRTLAEVADDFLSYALAVQTASFREEPAGDNYHMIHTWQHLRVTDHLPSSKSHDELLRHVLEHEATKSAIMNLALSTIERVCELAHIDLKLHSHFLPSPIVSNDSLENAIVRIVQFKLEFFAEAVCFEQIQTLGIDASSATERSAYELPKFAEAVKEFIDTLVKRCEEATK